MGIRITKMAVSNGNLNTVTRTLTKEIRDLNLYSILNPPPPLRATLYSHVFHRIHHGKFVRMLFAQEMV